MADTNKSHSNKTESRGLMMEKGSRLVTLVLTSVSVLMADASSPEELNSTASYMYTTDPQMPPDLTVDNLTTPAATQASTTSCLAAVSEWSPWTMKAANIKSNGCGIRQRTRRLLDPKANKGCKTPLADFKNECKSLCAHW